MVSNHRLVEFYCSEIMKKKSPDKKTTESPRYQAILDVAAEIFRIKGYHHANVSDIAEKVGLLKGSLYYHIKSKEELLYTIVSSSVAVYVQSLQDILTSNEKADILLRKAIISHMRPIGIQFDRIYVFLNEFKNLSDDYRKEIDFQIKSYSRLWMDIIEQGKKEGIFSPDLDSRIVTLSIFGACNWTPRWFRSEGEYRIEDIAEIYADIFLKGLNMQNE